MRSLIRDALFILLEFGQLRLEKKLFFPGLRGEVLHAPVDFGLDAGLRLFDRLPLHLGLELFVFPCAGPLVLGGLGLDLELGVLLALSRARVAGLLAEYLLVECDGALEVATVQSLVCESKRGLVRIYDRRGLGAAREDENKDGDERHGSDGDPSHEHHGIAALCRRHPRASDG